MTLSTPAVRHVATLAQERAELVQRRHAGTASDDELARLVTLTEELRSLVPRVTPDMVQALHRMRNQAQDHAHVLTKISRSIANDGNVEGQGR